MEAAPAESRTLGVNVNAADDLAHVVALVRASLQQRRRLLVTFVNPSTRDVMRRRPDYRRHLDLFDLVLPDGVGMSIAVRWLHGIAAARVSFDMTSLAVPVMQFAAENGYRVVLVGGRPGRAEQALLRLLERFPGLRVVGCFDGYGEIAARASQIVAAEPDIVVCGMGAGAQEEMLLGLTQAGWCGCASPAAASWTRSQNGWTTTRAGLTGYNCAGPTGWQASRAGFGAAIWSAIKIVAALGWHILWPYSAHLPPHSKAPPRKSAVAHRSRYTRTTRRPSGGADRTKLRRLRGAKPAHRGHLSRAHAVRRIDLDHSGRCSMPGGAGHVRRDEVSFATAGDDPTASAGVPSTARPNKPIEMN